jgi:hypothetical protein
MRTETARPQLALATLPIRAFAAVGGAMIRPLVRSVPPALVVARQCGKSLIGELYASNFALRGQGVLYTSHRADSTKLIFRRLLASLPEELGAEPTFTNGAEEIRFPSGGSIVFRTRGPRTARGFRFSKIVLDYRLDLHRLIESARPA